MKRFIERFSSLVKGTITGFDRIVFKGFVLPLMSANGAMQFCGIKGILNKNYKNWMMEQSASLNEAANEYGKKNCGKGVIPLSTWRIRKEKLAHERQTTEQIESGLIGIWSCLEAASSYRARYCEKSGYPQLKSYQTRCKHLYFYFDHYERKFLRKLTIALWMIFLR